MRVPEEPVRIHLFRKNPVFTSLHLKYPVHVVPPLAAVYLTTTRGSRKLKKYSQKRRLLRYRQLIFLAVPENYFSAEFRSGPFRASE
jgi:hypothetical protein